MDTDACTHQQQHGQRSDGAANRGLQQAVHLQGGAHTDHGKQHHAGKRRCNAIRQRAAKENGQRKRDNHIKQQFHPGRGRALIPDILHSLAELGQREQPGTEAAGEGVDLGHFAQVGDARLDAAALG